MKKELDIAKGDIVTSRHEAGYYIVTDPAYYPDSTQDVHYVKIKKILTGKFTKRMGRIEIAVRRFSIHIQDRDVLIKLIDKKRQVLEKAKTVLKDMQI